jgi:hypothetical protein
VGINAAGPKLCHKSSHALAGELVGADDPVLGGVLVVALLHQLVARQECQRRLVRGRARHVHGNVTVQHKVVLQQPSSGQPPEPLSGCPNSSFSTAQSMKWERCSAEPTDSSILVRVNQPACPAPTW